MNEPDRKARSGHGSPGFFLLSLIVALSHQVSGQPGTKIRSLSFDGVSALSVNVLRDEFTTKEGQLLAPGLLAADLQKLLEKYHNEGHLFCSAEPVITYNDDSSAADVGIVVREGRPVVVGPVEFAGTMPADARGKEVMPGLTKGDRFHPRMVEQGIEYLLKDLEARGYPFARVTVDRIEFITGSAADTAALAFSIDAGERVTVSELLVEGNITTQRSVIEREARVPDNTPFSDRMAARVKRRLDRLGIFSSVSIPELFVSREGKGGLLIRVKEGHPNRFDGILGYLPASGGQKGYVTGMVDLEFKNLFGTARGFSVRWIRENRSTQDLALQYREPWVASLPVDARLGFSQRKQDSTYLRRAYDLAASYSVSDDFSLGLSFRQSSVFPSERINNPVVRSDAWSLGGSLWYDSRENPENPTDGALYRSSYEAGNKSAGTGSNTRLTRVEFDVEYYLPIAGRQILAIALHGREVRSDLLEQSDLVRLGGTLTLRGYRESQFFCSRAAWMNIEYRFLSGRRSRLFAFVDGAYLALQDRPAAGLTGSEFSKLGYGLGAHVDSGIGTFGLSIGIGEGDTFQTAKLHVRWINEF